MKHFVSGIIHVNVTCKSVLTSTIVSDNLCANASKPPGTKACNAGDCPEIYEWKVIAGPCSVTCGTGKLLEYQIFPTRKCNYILHTIHFPIVFHALISPITFHICPLHLFLHVFLLLPLYLLVLDPGFHIHI